MVTEGVEPNPAARENSKEPPVVVPLHKIPGNKPTTCLKTQRPSSTRRAAAPPAIRCIENRRRRDEEIDTVVVGGVVAVGA